MASESETGYTRWALIGAGDAGGRLAMQLHATGSHPTFGGRLVVMNSNRTDIRNNINQIQRLYGMEEEPANVFTFGSEDGAGNNFAKGEMLANEDIGQIRSQLEAAGIFADSDAFLYATSLGGGTGCGAIPYVIHHLQENSPQPVTTHSALAIWPDEFTGPQEKFNAVCGLSRLLQWDKGEKNADMTIILSNDCASEHISKSHERPGYEQINQYIIDILKLIGDGFNQTYNPIDVSQYVNWPSKLDSYHATPGLVIECEPDMRLREMFDRAADNPLVPMDPTTSRFSYAIVRAPEDRVSHRDQKSTLTIRGAQREFSDWLKINDYDNIQYHTISLVPDSQKTDSIDVLLLFGGFDLRPLLSNAMSEFDGYIENLSPEDEEINRYMNIEAYQELGENLREYVDEHKQPHYLLSYLPDAVIESLPIDQYLY